MINMNTVFIKHAIYSFHPVYVLVCMACKHQCSAHDRVSVTGSRNEF